jgi:hypothetical protein
MERASRPPFKVLSATLASPRSQPFFKLSLVRTQMRCLCAIATSRLCVESPSQPHATFHEVEHTSKSAPPTFKCDEICVHLRDLRANGDGAMESVFIYVICGLQCDVSATLRFSPAMESASIRENRVLNAMERWLPSPRPPRFHAPATSSPQPKPMLNRRANPLGKGC